MVMVVDQSEETSSTGKKKTKKGKKVKIAGTAAQEGSGGMANGGGEETAESEAMGGVQDGTVMEDPETLARFEVGWPLAKEGVLTLYRYVHLISSPRALIHPKWPTGSLLRVLMRSKTTSLKVGRKRKQSYLRVCSYIVMMWKLQIYLGCLSHH